MRKQRPTWSEVRPWLFDGALALGVGLLLTGMDRLGKPLSAIWVLAGVVIGAGLLVRRRYPIVTVAAVFVANLLVFGDVAANFTAMVAVYTAASRRGTATITWIVVGIAAIAVGTPFHAMPGFNLTVVFVIVAPALPTGLWVGQRRRLMDSLRERAAQAERERDLLAGRAVTAERQRIAREMHDVVAHRVSLISLQAGALSVTSDDERVTPVAELIRQTSATALAELRDVLHALRDDDTSDQSATTQATLPTFATVRTLVDDAVAAGSRIDLEMPDAVPDIPSSVQRAVYRVVQESLTNASKHASGADVQVTVTAGEEGIAVQVFNTRGHDETTVPGSGYGLLGMRERVSLAGGTLRAEPTVEGGFRVQAWFPLDGVPEEERA